VDGACRNSEGCIAVPLLMRLNDEQKHEVKMLAFVMGLEAVAAHF
jgi:hypothetical protein